MMKTFRPLIAACLLVSLAACSSPQPERFEDFFSRAQKDPAFRSSRVAKNFSATEEISREDAQSSEKRAIPCGYREIEENGWELLPSPAVLKETGAVYSAPEMLSDDTVKIALGPPEGSLDGELYFELQDKKWYFTRATIFTSLQADDPLPRVPCNE